jgi:carbonic anhydrase
MQPLIDNARLFGKRPEEFARLVEGQSPQLPSLTCCDSRVVPALITGARPGELFELRTAGHIVPPCATATPTGEKATIEYAVQVLGVKHVWLCGHSHCGTIGAVARPDDLAAVPAVHDWLVHTADEPKRSDITDPTVAEAVQNHALTQLERLRSYPCIGKRVEAGELQLHGCYHEVHTGIAREHDAESATFEMLCGSW